jgi:sugar phosphate isomerase/epimerase
MRIGIVHPALGAEVLDEAFARAAQAGADGVEVDYASAALATALGDAAHAKELADAAKGAGVAAVALRLTCLREQPSLIGRPEMIGDYQHLLLSALGCAAEAGAPIVTVPFFGKNTIEVEDELSRAADALLEMVDHAEEAGVVLSVESTLAFHQQEFLINHLGNTGDVKVCCNTAVGLSRKLDVPMGLRQLGAGAIAFVRFRDVRMAENEPPDFDVPLGEGHVDFRAVAQAIHAIGYDEWVVVDPIVTEQTLNDPVPTAQAAVAFARELLQNTVG